MHSQKSCMLVGLVLCLLIVAPTTAWAQRQRGAKDNSNPFPFSDEFFEQFIPKATNEDEEDLDKVNISKADEQRLGRSMVANYLDDLKSQRIKVVHKGDDVNYLKALVATIQPLMENGNGYPEIDVYIVKSSVPDARSFPGGTLFFYEGLLELAESEAALVGVVGHELSHLDHGHQLIMMKQSRIFEKGLNQNGKTFNPQQFFASGMQMMRMMSRPFRPQDESTADLDAVAWMYEAGYDPREFSKLLLRLRERISAKESVPIPAFLRSHPPTRERSEAVLAQLDELQKKSPKPRLYVGRENLDRRIPRSVKEFEEKKK